MAEEGRAIAKWEGLVIFIEKVVPGDIVDVRIRKKHSSYLEGELVELKKPSPLRIDPFCQHFGTCGGCKWQYLDYESQLKYKQKQVTETLIRIGKIPNPNVMDILGSANTRYYRNKLDYTFADKKWLTREEYAEREEAGGPALGFHIPGKFDKVLDIETCYLQPDPSNAIRLAVRKYCLEHEIPFMNLRHKAGMMRGLIIRNTLAGGLMVIVMVYENEQEVLEGLLRHLETTFPQITSLLYIVNPKGNDTFHDLEVKTWSGLPYITEEMEGLHFRIGPKSFFQTNSGQTLELYKIARDFAGLQGHEIVYDLYTGTGTIALFISRNVKKVVGIEYVQESIENAKLNAELNGVSNSVFFAGDMKDLLKEELFRQEGHPDVIITDPPRAGMHFDVVEQLLKSNCPKIVYVSCNPATQARDVQMLSEKYDLIKVQPVDMFPHTAHVESVALLQLRG
ncbi:MAG: 23S rRNA (uracil(1939)-C(5))-methyltransferase RlmD [Bacteroidetes bacterium]|nr:23S rRNA (uracil(1939)-C(5))-methyltransferase RlmD [Bacteroidota bacterium]